MLLFLLPNDDAADVLLRICLSREQTAFEEGGLR